MKLEPKLCVSPESIALMDKCRKNYSDDSAPFHLSQLQLFDLHTKSPISKQTIKAALCEFMENFPEGIFNKHLHPDSFEMGKLKFPDDWRIGDQQNYLDRLKGLLTGFASTVRSPFAHNPSGCDVFLTQLFHFLGNPKFFVERNSLFYAPNYYCPNINFFIVTQNHRKFPVDKLALFSFFCPD